MKNALQAATPSAFEIQVFPLCEVLHKGKSYLACCIAKQACKKRRSARYVRLPDLLMERDELAATERSNAKILKKYAHYEILVLDEWLTEDVDELEQEGY